MTPDEYEVNKAWEEMEEELLSQKQITHVCMSCMASREQSSTSCNRCGVQCPAVTPEEYEEQFKQ